MNTPAAITGPRFTGDEYDEMVRTGTLDDEDKGELLEGYMVLKLAGLTRRDRGARNSGRRDRRHDSR